MNGNYNNYNNVNNNSNSGSGIVSLLLISPTLLFIIISLLPLATTLSFFSFSCQLYIDNP